jgi:hypothetical protein
VHRPSSQSFCPHQRRALQVRGRWHTHAVYPQRSKSRAVARDT